MRAAPPPSPDLDTRGNSRSNYAAPRRRAVLCRAYASIDGGVSYSVLPAAHTYGPLLVQSTYRGCVASWAAGRVFFQQQKCDVVRWLLAIVSQIYRLLNIIFYRNLSAKHNNGRLLNVWSVSDEWNHGTGYGWISIGTCRGRSVSTSKRRWRLVSPVQYAWCCDACMHEQSSTMVRGKSKAKPFLRCPGRPRGIDAACTGCVCTCHCARPSRATNKG